MILVKNYESAVKFVKVMPRKLWPLFSRTRCIIVHCLFITLIQIRLY